MFIGKGAAMAQGLNATTRDLDIYPAKATENRKSLLAALEDLGYSMEYHLGDRVISLADEILSGKDFIQFLKPFDLDIVFAPDGFENYDEAKRYKIVIDGYPLMSIQGIIISKQAAGRARDKQDLPMLQQLKEWLDGLDK